MHDSFGLVTAALDTENHPFAELLVTHIVTNAQAGSKAGWTPYDGKRVTGWPIGTIVRGRRVMWDGEIVEAGRGEPVLFSEALPG